MRRQVGARIVTFEPNFFNDKSGSIKPNQTIKERSLKFSVSSVQPKKNAIEPATAVELERVGGTTKAGPEAGASADGYASG